MPVRAAMPARVAFGNVQHASRFPLPSPLAAMSLGTSVWHELTTDDPVAAKSFYTQIAPWETKEWDDYIEYTLWTCGEKALGGPDNELTPLWWDKNP